MSFLSSCATLLAGASSIKITLQTNADKALVVQVFPKIEKAKADETDETIAKLAAALAFPIKVVIPEGEDPDAAFTAQLMKVDEHRAPLASDLERYLETLDEARNQAKLATEAKAKKDAESKATKGGKGGKKPADTKKPAPKAEPADASKETDATPEAAADATTASTPPAADATSNTAGADYLAAKEGDGEAAASSSPTSGSASNLFDL